MPTAPATHRLSPKVRRLLLEHDLHARSVAGTGTGGRVTPHDVLGAAGVPRRAGDGGVLASPLARRLLRDAGVELAAAGRANEGNRLTRVDAERVIDQLVDGTTSTQQEAQQRRGQPRAVTSEVEVDAAVLLASIAVANQDFLAHNGFEVSAEVALASAATAVLVHRPELAVATTLPPSDDGRAYPSVHIGFPGSTASGADIAVVPDAQYLTVAGLARRARAAVTGAAAAPTTPSPAMVVATDATSPGELPASAAIGLLTIGSPVPRPVATVDDLGHEVVSTRPHVVVRLHHDDRTAPAAAAAFLEAIEAAVTSWSLPAGP